MAFNDGDNGENFMTVLGFPQFGNNMGTFPKMWESKGPTIDKYLMQKIIELEQEIKALKEEIKKLRHNHDYARKHTVHRR